MTTSAGRPLEALDRASPRLRLERGEAEVTIDPINGGRIASLRVGGLDLLLDDRRDDPILWGMYPMAPWAGRLRDGRLPGGHPPIPANLGQHALHGTGFISPWVVDDAGDLHLALAPPWPFRGRLTQRVRLGSGRLEVRLELHAVDEQPACLGYHPWFPRRLGGEDAQVTFTATGMLRRDGVGIPTGEVVPVPPGPYDDAFIGVAQPVVVRWPGVLRLELTAPQATHWVRFDELPDRFCLEPQTGPPDAPNQRDRVIVPAGGCAALDLELRWSRDIAA